MIIQLRIDERLIHGQITTAWSKALMVNGIVVANDKLARDQLVCQTLLMAAPAGIRVAVKSIDDAITLLKDPRGEKMRMLVIVDNPKDAIALVKALPIKDINCANYVKKKSKDKVEVCRGVNADPEDLAYFKELTELGENVFNQLIPSYQAVKMTDALSKIK